VSGQEVEHEPVLSAEVADLLNPRPGRIVLDGTVGLGGHAAVLLPRIIPGGRYVGIDVDAAMLAAARQRFAADAPISFSAANYAEFADVLAAERIERVDYALLDLGVNSAQLSDQQRGFSFVRDGPLDMRFDQRTRQNAADLVNSLPEGKLADLFYEYGQETRSRKIAKRICKLRHEQRIATTRALALAVESAIGGRGASRLHGATRVFQALRIAVNRELENLAAFLPRIVERLSVGGRLAVISFHSLEDGIVKRFLREARKRGRMRELTKRPVVPERAETRSNPRSRSAKLRVAERIE